MNSIFVDTSAWDVFEQYNADKQWSFTDCMSYKEFIHPSFAKRIILAEGNHPFASIR
jgi:hypothetical protein